MKKRFRLYGAILGDLCGQPHEFPSNEGFDGPVLIHNPLSKITDDTIMTIATAYALITNISFEEAYKEFGLRYNGDLYGKDFSKWLKSPAGTVGSSWGNGCVMRISPILYLPNGIIKNIWIRESVRCSHDNKESYEAVSALNGMYCEEPIHSGAVPQKFNRFIVKAVPTVKFVEEAYASSSSTHEAILTAVKCGGDTDTNASIVGELSNFWRNDIDSEDVDYVNSKLDPQMIAIIRQFNEELDDLMKYNNG